MSVELAPARPDAALAPLAARSGLVLAAGCLAAATLFWSPLLFGGALQGGDWATHHFHYFDWVRTALTGFGSLPLYMADAWVTPNFLGNAESPSFGPLAWLLWLLPTGVYIKMLVVVSTAASLAGCWLLLRDLEVAPALAALAAAGFSWGGFFVSHVTVGHHWAMGAWLLPLLFWLFRRGALGSQGALVAAAALNAFTILGGQHQPFIWQNLVLGSFAVLWAARARAWFPLTSLALVFVLAAGLGAVKLLPVLLEFRDYAPTARIQGLPLGSLLASLAAPGLDRDFVDPRIAYQHGAGWWEYAFYLGPLALLALGTGCLFRLRESWPLLAVGGFFLVISLESLGVWPLLADLPVWRSQRCPSRFALLTIFAVSIAGAVGLESLRRAADARWPRATLALLWILTLGAGLDLWRESLPWQRAGVGEAIESREHRPRPRVRDLPGGRVELVRFAPNELTYRVEATRSFDAPLPLRFGLHGVEWEVEGGEARRAGEVLSVAVPEGVTELRVSYRPPGLRAGLAISALSVAVAAGGMLWRRRREVA